MSTGRYLFGALCITAGIATAAQAENAREQLEDYGIEIHDPTNLSISLKGRPSLTFNLTEDEEYSDGSLKGASVDEIARQSSNPLGGDFMVMINEFTYSWKESNVSAFDNGNSFTQIFQPVIPISMADVIGPNWILVNRPTFAYVWDLDVPSPGAPPGLSSIDGFGDISHFSLLGTSTPSENNLLGRGDTVLAAGFSVNIPVGNSDITNDNWALGPAAVAAYIGEKGILGALGQTQFDIDNGNGAYNRAFLQPFYYKSFPGGWQVGGAPLMVFNFDTDDHSIPIGFGVQKTQVFDLKNGGKLPIRFGLEARYFVDKPKSYGDEWALVFQVSPIIPNIVSNLIRKCPAMSVGGC